MVGLTLLLALVGACGAPELFGLELEQGVQGLALLGPQCPVQSQDHPCPDLPHQAWITVRTASGKNVTRVFSGTDGRFRVGLVPGAYVLDPESGSPFPIAQETSVQVLEGVFVEVTISFDTGLR